HVTEACLGIPRSLVHRMTPLRIQVADLVPCHPRLPDGMPRNIAVIVVAENLTIDFQRGAEFTLFAPQSRLAEHTVFGVEVFFPKLSRFHNVIVSVKIRKALLGSLIRHAGIFLYCTRAFPLFARILCNPKTLSSG